MNKRIPLQQIPNQRLNVSLAGQHCTIKIYTKGEYMYMDFSADGREIRTGVICLTGINLLTYPTPYFTGGLWFADLKRKHGVPNYFELGTRYVLCYADDL